MDLGVLDFALDPTLIAQQPLSTRDGSRMLVLERATGACTHTAVAKLVDWLRPHDVLVVNDAEVIAARLHGKRPTGGNVEVLLVEPIEADGTWQCLARGAGRIPAGETDHVRRRSLGRSGESARARSIAAFVCNATGI